LRRVSRLPLGSRAIQSLGPVSAWVLSIKARERGAKEWPCLSGQGRAKALKIFRPVRLSLGATAPAPVITGAAPLVLPLLTAVTAVVVAKKQLLVVAHDQCSKWSRIV